MIAQGRKDAKGGGPEAAHNEELCLLSFTWFGGPPPCVETR
jgi:hypothetical protein